MLRCAQSSRFDVLEVRFPASIYARLAYEMF